MNKDRLRRIQDRVLHKHGGGTKLSGPDDFVMVHHVLMREYGWIPLDQFRDLPLPTLWNLLDCIRQEKEAQEREMNKTKAKSRTRRRR